MAEALIEAKTALSNEIKELKDTRRKLEKEAKKTTLAILNSSDSSEKKLADRRQAKKAMKESLVNTKIAIKEKNNALSLL